MKKKQAFAFDIFNLLNGGVIVTGTIGLGTGVDVAMLGDYSREDNESVWNGYCSYRYETDNYGSN